MTRPYPYQLGTYDIGSRHSGLETFYRLSKRRWGFKGLGTFVARLMHGKPYLSVHATGNACDLGYGTTSKERQKAVEACQWFVVHNFKLGVVAIHDYAAPGNPRAWRCDRGEWVTYANGELGAGGRWLHVELDPKHGVMPAAEYERLWRSLPRP